MSEDLTREILERDNRELRDTIDKLNQLLSRPVGVTVSAPPGPDQPTLKKVAEYLPQLSHISTNLSHVASAVQAVNATLQSIDTTLKKQVKDERP